LVHFWQAQRVGWWSCSGIFDVPHDPLCLPHNKPKTASASFLIKRVIAVWAGFFMTL
jgi:hypothetical protein